MKFLRRRAGSGKKRDMYEQDTVRKGAVGAGGGGGGDEIRLLRRLEARWSRMGDPNGGELSEQTGLEGQVPPRTQLNAQSSVSTLQAAIPATELARGPSRDAQWGTPAATPSPHLESLARQSTHSQVLQPGVLHDYPSRTHRGQTRAPHSEPLNRVYQLQPSGPRLPEPSLPSTASQPRTHNQFVAEAGPGYFEPQAKQYLHRPSDPRLSDSPLSARDPHNPPVNRPPSCPPPPVASTSRPSPFPGQYPTYPHTQSHSHPQPPERRRSSIQPPHGEHVAKEAYGADRIPESHGAGHLTATGTAAEEHREPQPIPNQEGDHEAFPFPFPLTPEGLEQHLALPIPTSPLLHLLSTPTHFFLHTFLPGASRPSITVRVTHPYVIISARQAAPTPGQVEEIESWLNDGGDVEGEYLVRVARLDAEVKDGVMGRYKDGILVLGFQKVGGGGVREITWA